MKNWPRRIALCVVVLLTVVAWRALRDPTPAAQGSTNVSADVPANASEPEPSAAPQPTSAPLDERASVATPVDAGAAAAKQSTLARRDLLDELLERLRSASKEPEFHALAWPIVNEIGAHVRAHDDDPLATDTPRARLRAIVVAPAAEHEFVRAGCLLGFALGAAREEVEALAESALLDASFEVQRAAWFAVSLAGDAAVPIVLQARGFRAVKSARFFPCELARLAPERWRQRARERALRRLPEEWSEPWPLTKPNALGDMVTREVAVLACLGPAVGEPGWERDLLLDWLRAPRSPEVMLRSVAAYCLARRQARRRTGDDARAHCTRVARGK